jgi:hypothetical protein
MFMLDVLQNMCRVADLHRRLTGDLECERDALRLKNAALVEENQYLKLKVAEEGGRAEKHVRR